ncbi:MAG: MucR family transcriptional regulator [Magnetococcales bacterium]|nr:MucR family transcriptional regulator [Magnetococcales bacterium]
MNGFFALLTLLAVIGGFALKMMLDKRASDQKASQQPQEAPPDRRPDEGPDPSLPSPVERESSERPSARFISKPAPTPKAKPTQKPKPPPNTKESAQAKQGEKPAKSKQRVDTPVLSIEDSIQQEALICLICGKSNKLLKAHLKRSHQLEPEQYRKRFKLPDSYPMTPAKKSGKSKRAKGKK